VKRFNHFSYECSGVSIFGKFKSNNPSFCSYILLITLPTRSILQPNTKIIKIISTFLFKKSLLKYNFEK